MQSMLEVLASFLTYISVNPIDPQPLNPNHLLTQAAQDYPVEHPWDIPKKKSRDIPYLSQKISKRFPMNLEMSLPFITVWNNKKICWEDVLCMSCSYTFWLNIFELKLSVHHEDLTRDLSPTRLYIYSNTVMHLTNCGLWQCQETNR